MDSSKQKVALKSRSNYLLNRRFLSKETFRTGAFIVSVLVLSSCQTLERKPNLKALRLEREEIVPLIDRRVPLGYIKTVYGPENLAVVSRMDNEDLRAGKAVEVLGGGESVPVLAEITSAIDEKYFVVRYLDGKPLAGHKVVLRESMNIDTEHE